MSTNSHFNFYNYCSVEVLFEKVIEQLEENYNTKDGEYNLVEQVSLTI